jgi:predicted nucleic acid-binding protein
MALMDSYKIKEIVTFDEEFNKVSNIRVFE